MCELGLGEELEGSSGQKMIHETSGFLSIIKEAGRAGRDVLCHYWESGKDQQPGKPFGGGAPSCPCRILLWTPRIVLSSGRVVLFAEAPGSHRRGRDVEVRGIKYNQAGRLGDSGG